MTFETPFTHWAFIRDRGVSRVSIENTVTVRLLSTSEFWYQTLESRIRTALEIVPLKLYIL